MFVSLRTPCVSFEASKCTLLPFIVDFHKILISVYKVSWKSFASRNCALANLKCDPRATELGQPGHRAAPSRTEPTAAPVGLCSGAVGVGSGRQGVAEGGGEAGWG